jgi:uncharacterized membrane protein HdeD (DUF308 family)
VTKLQIYQLGAALIGTGIALVIACFIPDRISHGWIGILLGGTLGISFSLLAQDIATYIYQKLEMKKKHESEY